MTNDLRKIVWLVSYPKSGNTWFRAFLADLLFDIDNDIDINELYTIPVASSRLLFDNNAGISSSNLSSTEIENIRPKIYENIASESDSLLFLKAHDAWKITPSGEELFPDRITKKVIYIIRNPLDIAVSYAFHSGKTFASIINEVNDKNHAYCIKNDQLFHQLEQHLSDWSSHIKSWLDYSTLPVLVMRYEDMLKNTFQEFKNVLSAIGIEKTDSDIKKSIEAVKFAKLSEKEAKDGFKEKPINMKAFFRNGNSGNWREHLTPNDVKVIIDKHGSLMERFGYLKENKPLF